MFTGADVLGLVFYGGIVSVWFWSMYLSGGSDEWSL